MDLRKVELQFVMSHDDTFLELPETGIVVVMGPNGAGKSTILEAVPAAVWGKTLRGTPWYREGKTSVVTVDVGGEVIARSRKKAKTLVHWEGQPDADTASKAQIALDNRFGTAKAWRRTHVFSSQDADHFSKATDGDRKKLLERILGVDRFDGALKACKVDLRAAEAAHSKVEAQIRVLTAKIEERERALEKVAAVLGPEPTKPDTGELEEMERELQEKVALINTLLEGKRKAGDMLRDAQKDLHRIEREIAQFASGVCPTCERPPEPDTMNGLQRKREAAEQTVGKLEKTYRGGVKICDAKVHKTQCRIDDLRAHKSDWRLEDAEHKRWLKAKAEQEQETQGDRDEISKLKCDLLDAEDELDGLVVEVETLQAAAKALGLRGVRAHVLDEAAKGIQQIANLWLARLFPGVELALGGASSDQMTLEVTGLAHAYGYKGASGGERRRIDIALLLALAEVSAGVFGTTTNGTLFFDEVLDTLDGEGVEAVSGTLEEMAKDRLIIVISHTDELANKLPAVKRLRVVDGSIT